MKNIKYEVRPVVGYEGLYSVSNDGRVFSHNYRRTGETRELKPAKNSGGYLYVVLCQDGKQKHHKVHRLVLEAFIDNPDNKSCCDHIDTDRANNHVSNLRWCTIKENQNNPLTKTKMSAAKQGKKPGNYDSTRYTFRNKNTGQVFVGTRYNFYTKYDLYKSHVSALIYGKCKSVKGWVLV